MMTLYARRPFYIERFRSGPLGSYMDGFAQALNSAGYARKTSQVYLGCAAHLGNWLRRARVRRGVDDSVVDRFCRHLSSCRCPAPIGSRSPNVARGAIRRLLCHLREVGALNAEPEPSPLPQVLRDFDQWMRQHRGVCDSTLHIYRPALQDLLETAGEEPARYTAGRIREFVLRRTSQRGIRQATSTVVAVKMFLRYLASRGECPAGLEAAVPRVASWSLSSLPRGLPSEDVERILSVCDPQTPFGRRDRAIMLLLARLGLRAGDVLRLRLGDIDWEQATLKVLGKGRREALLPLPQEVGDAMLVYLEHDRPQTDDDHAFFRVLAPQAPLSGNAVSQIVSRAMRRAGVTGPSRGAHVLRCSAASELLKLSLIHI